MDEKELKWGRGSEAGGSTTGEKKRRLRKAEGSERVSRGGEQEAKAREKRGKEGVVR